MKANLQYFIQHLIVQDYILFALAFILFLLFIILALVLKRSMIISLILIFLAFGSLFGLPTLGYSAMHNFLFANKTTISTIKALEFTNILVIKGELNNESKRNFKECKIQASVYKIAHNALLDTLYPLNPFKKTSIIELNIDKNSTRAYKLIVENFNYKKDYNVSIKANCL